MMQDHAFRTRAVQHADRRYQAACLARDAVAAVVAEKTAAGRPTSEWILNDYIVARARAFEARADWKQLQEVLR